MKGSGGNQTQPTFTPEQEARIRELFGEELARERAARMELMQDVANAVAKALRTPGLGTGFSFPASEGYGVE